MSEVPLYSNPGLPPSEKGKLGTLLTFAVNMEKLTFHVHVTAEILPDFGRDCLIVFQIFSLFFITLKPRVE